MFPYRASVYSCLTAIHQLVLKQSGHLLQSGQQPTPLLAPPPISHITTTDNTEELEDSSAPTSFRLLMERVLLNSQNSGKNGALGEFYLPYVGPLTFHRFLKCFCEIYRQKSASVESEKECLARVLRVLGKTSQEVAVMERTLASLQKDHDAATTLCSSLMEDLTSKSCKVRKKLH